MPLLSLGAGSLVTAVFQEIEKLGLVDSFFGEQAALMYKNANCLSVTVKTTDRYAKPHKT